MLTCHFQSPYTLLTCDGGHYSRHEVAFLYLITVTYVAGYHPACACRYPKEARYRCADDGVRSPPDNVPNWEETARQTPLREIHLVKG